MKLTLLEKKLITALFFASILATVLYLFLNPVHFLTSQNFLINGSSSQNTEKTLAAIINSTDFNKDLGLSTSVIVAAEKTTNVLEFKTSSKSENESIQNFRKYEQLIIAKLKQINSQIELVPVSSSPDTRQISPDYLKIIALSLISWIILSFLVVSANRYLR